MNGFLNLACEPVQTRQSSLNHFPFEPELEHFPHFMIFFHQHEKTKVKEREGRKRINPSSRLDIHGWLLSQLEVSFSAEERFLIQCMLESEVSRSQVRAEQL